MLFRSAWPRGSDTLDLGHVERHDLTELVQVRLRLGEQTCAWIMRAPAEPAFDVDRDRARR